MSMTLLDYTQKILASMTSDQVNSITDTDEASIVADMIETAYKEIVARADLNEHFGLYNLVASGDSAKPTIMTRPETALSIAWVKYDVQTAADPVRTFRDVKYLELPDFLARMYSLRADDDNVDTITHGSLIFLCYNDRAPTYYTTYDDNTLLFDAFDNTVDTTLQASKTLAWGRKDQTWTKSDTFVPFLDPDFEILLLNEAKALAFAELKQQQNPKAEMSAKRLWSKEMASKRAVNNPRSELDRTPNFGRRKTW